MTVQDIANIKCAKINCTNSCIHRGQQSITQAKVKVHAVTQSLPSLQTRKGTLWTSAKCCKVHAANLRLKTYLLFRWVVALRTTQMMNRWCCYHAQQWWVIQNQKESARENQSTDLRSSTMCLRPSESAVIIHYSMI